MKKEIKHYLGTLRHKKSKEQRSIAAASLSLSLMKSSDKNYLDLLNYRFFFSNFELFKILFGEVFVAGTYYLDGLGPSPRIIDAGGNIGLATLFFKYHYPNAKIDVFEPSSINFSLLEKNIQANSLKDVECHNVALALSEGEIELFERKDVEGGDIGVSISKSLRENFHKEDEIQAIKVPAKKLSSYIDEEVDLLKLDIEGSEGAVLEDLLKSSKIKMVKNIIMEFHSIPENRLSRFLDNLDRANFAYTISQWGPDVKNPAIFHCILRGHRL